MRNSMHLADARIPIPCGVRHVFTRRAARAAVPGPSRLHRLRPRTMCLAASAGRPEQQENARNALLRSPAILVVDDDGDCCRNLADLLVDLGYEVDIACDGNQALEMARRRPYGAGLFDLRMPGIDGLELCREVRQLWPSMVMMIITGFVAAGVEQRARSAGAAHVFLKPIDCNALFERLHEALPPAD